MRITYIARSFLDYRVPVLEALNHLSDGQLRFISSTKWTPARALDQLHEAIGENAVYLAGEKSIGVDMPNYANKNICIPYQPGLVELVINTRPDVLIGDGFFQWTYAPLLLRILKGIPLVICYERWGYIERNAQWYRKLYRKAALKVIDTVCCNGILSKDYTISLGMPAQRITTGHMAADTDNLARQVSKVSEQEKKSLRSELNLKGIVFLYVGRLIHRKGVAQLIDAWAKFEDIDNEATLLVVGDGPEYSHLKGKTAHLGLKCVQFAGAVDYSWIAFYYATSDVFIIPTLEDNWSLVVPEAMACGLPILCSKYNGCWPELVNEGLNGWVFDPLETTDVLKSLKNTIKYRKELEAMGNRSREIIAEYSPQKAAESIYKACKIAFTRRNPSCAE